MHCAHRDGWDLMGGVTGKKMPPLGGIFMGAISGLAFDEIVRTNLTNLGDLLVGEQPESELVQFRVMSQGNQEGATDFTVTEFVVFQGGGGNTQQISKLGTAQADGFADLADLLANSVNV